jgi:hypothetical protein
VPTHPSVATAACALADALAVTGGALAGCGAPPEVPAGEGSTVGPSPSAASGTPSAGPTGTAAPGTPPPSDAPTTGPPSPTGFPDTYAVSCAGRPSGAQIIRLLRRQAGLLPDGVRARVDTGPLCAGSWQYTVVVVTGREPLAVVTRRETDGLRLVTAGTNVCSIPVRTQAPIGIRTAAAC